MTRRVRFPLCVATVLSRTDRRLSVAATDGMLAARERLADHVNVTISVYSLLPAASESTYLYCSADVSVCDVY